MYINNPIIKMKRGYNTKKFRQKTLKRNTADINFHYNSEKQPACNV